MPREKSVGKVEKDDEGRKESKGVGGATARIHRQRLSYLRDNSRVKDRMIHKEVTARHSPTFDEMHFNSSPLMNIPGKYALITPADLRRP